MEKNVTPINNGAWSSTVPQTPMYYMHVEVEWLEKALGTTPSNTEAFSKYIASNATSIDDTAEEIKTQKESLNSEENNLQVNIYPKGNFYYDSESDRFIDMMDVNHPEINEDEHEFVENVPFYYNYQIRGFFKDSAGLLSRAKNVDEDGKEKGITESSKIKAYKKVIDGCIFVFPRRIGIKVPDYYLDDDGTTMLPSHDGNGNLHILSRPIHITGASGEREAIASSEMIPAGSRMKFTIGMTSPKYKPAVIEWLNYAVVHGISGWRNSGLGILRWREIGEDYKSFNE